MTAKIYITGLWLTACLCVTAPAAERRGGLVLSFDDGYPSWRTTIAPILYKHGGRATGYVNIQYIESGRISWEDLRALQDEFGWEIGSHSYHHTHAPRYVEKHGMDAWLENELDPSLAALREAGLAARSLVFPFNATTPELARAVRGRVDSFRRTDPIAISEGLRADGSIPGSAIDLTRYIPLRQLLRWVDAAHRRGHLLFLYGHRVLPDDYFFTGPVVAVGDDYIETDRDVILKERTDLVLVTDVDRRALGRAAPAVSSIDGRRVFVEGVSAKDLAAAGQTFLVGPSYGTRVSDFKALVAYAAEKVYFYTVRDLVEGRHERADTVQPSGRVY